MGRAVVVAGSALPAAASFGALLRHHREAAGLSQEDLAELAGLTAAAIGALERGERRRPYPHTVQLLADALQLGAALRTAFIAAVAAAPAPPAPFVGRQAELTSLRAHLADAAAGQGGLVLLIGEAGIGKSCLARRFAAEAASQGAVVLWGWCYEGDWQPPYGPWVEALRAHVRTCAADGTLGCLLAALGHTAAPLARLIPDVAAALPDLPVHTPLSPDEERFRLYDAVIRFVLAAAADQPVVLVLDDLHWADADSLRLLRHLARSLAHARALVVGAYRDPEFGLTSRHPLVDTLSVLRREVDYAQISLTGFNHDELAQYLAGAAGGAGDALPVALVKTIEEETGGNPFFTHEVLRHLVEESKLVHRNGRWSTDHGAGELGIPDGVRQVVGRRVARLSEQTGAVLRLAAGFTGRFSFAVLEALCQLPEHALLDCLDEALEAGLIRHGGAPPRYEFTHAIVRHTLYDGLNPDRRARLHRRIAHALERVQDGTDTDRSAELAAQYHASASLPGADRGIPPALDAARRAHEAYSHERAASYLRVARDLAVDRPLTEQAEILCALARCESEAVELDRAPQTAAAALEAMGVTGAPPVARAEFLAGVARALKEAGASAAVWRPFVDRGLELVGDTRDLLWARLALLRDRFEPIRSGPIGAVRWLGSDAEAVAVARAGGDEEDYARTLEPLDSPTRDETRAVLALASTWTRPFAVMRALDVAARALAYRHGDFPEAVRVYEHLLAAGQRYGSIPAQAEALSNIGSTQIGAGRLLEGKATIARAMELVARLGPDHRLHLMATTRAIGVGYYLDADWPTLAAAGRAYATSEAAVHSPVGLVAAAFAALAATRAGDAVAAHALLRDVTSVAERMGPGAYAQSVALGAAASAAWELADATHAATYYRLVLELVDAGAGCSVFGPLVLQLARMASLLSDHRAARAHLACARQETEALDLPHVRAIADYDEALVLLRAGDPDPMRIAALLDAAADAFLT
ncbi:MAG TPA: AAA family ATPase, partial [Chloroflexota bacterium]|nr:AAA family ATPase [Chloroflexota bacterium]